MSDNILKTKRLEAGWSQRDLAAVSGVNRNTIKDIERELDPRRPHPKTVRKLAKALGVMPADLVGLYQQRQEVTA